MILVRCDECEDTRDENLEDLNIRKYSSLNRRVRVAHRANDRDQSAKKSLEFIKLGSDNENDEYRIRWKHGQWDIMETLWERENERKIKPTIHVQNTKPYVEKNSLVKKTSIKHLYNPTYTILENPRTYTFSRPLKINRNFPPPHALNK